MADRDVAASDVTADEPLATEALAADVALGQAADEEHADAAHTAPEDPAPEDPTPEDATPAAEAAPATPVVLAAAALILLGVGYALGHWSPDSQPAGVLAGSPAIDDAPRSGPSSDTPPEYFEALAELNLKFALTARAADALLEARARTDDPAKRYVLSTRLSNTYSLLGDPQRALNAAREAQAEQVSPELRDQATARVLEIVLATDRQAEAKALLTKLSQRPEQHSRDLRIALGRGWLRVAKSGDSAQGRPALEALAARYPDDRGLRGWLGLLLLGQERAAGLKLLEDTLREDPNDVALFRRALEALPDDERLEVGLKLVEVVLEESPRRASHYCELARKLCADAGRPLDAFRWLERSNRDREPDLGLLARLALAAQQAKLHEVAAKYYGRAADASGSDQERYGFVLRQAESLWRSGSKDRAQALLAEIAAEAPAAVQARASTLLSDLNQEQSSSRRPKDED